MADLDDADRGLRDLTVDEAARRRSERDDLRRLTAESAALRDVVAAIAADGHQLIVHLPGGTRTGPVVTLGADYLEMGADGATLVVVSAAIGAVERGPADAAIPPVEASPTDVRERLRLRQGEGRPVTVGLRDGSVLTGRLDVVGEDVLTLDRRPLDGPAYVALESLALVSG